MKEFTSDSPYRIALASDKCPFCNKYLSVGNSISEDINSFHCNDCNLRISLSKSGYKYSEISFTPNEIKSEKYNIPLSIYFSPNYTYTVNRVSTQSYIDLPADMFLLDRQQLISRIRTIINFS